MSKLNKTDLGDATATGFQLGSDHNPLRSAIQPVLNLRFLSSLSLIQVECKVAVIYV